MKITITNNKCVPFEIIPEGTVFRDTDFQDRYYIKTVSVVDENGEESKSVHRKKSESYQWQMLPRLLIWHHRSP